jgi:hypothetical protein
MKPATTVLLATGGALYVLTAGGASLLLSSLAAAGVYAGNQALAGDDLEATINELQNALDQLPEGQRKRQLEAAKARFVRDQGTLKIASCALAAGTFINPLVGVGWFAGACFFRYRDKAREVKLRSERMA